MSSPHTCRPLMGSAELAGLLGLSHRPTPEQTAAIEADLRPCVVIAGAGSGKTQTMGLRVAWLVANGLVEPDQVLGLTFTRKAAGELTSRIDGLLRRLRHAIAAHPDAVPDSVGPALQQGSPTVATYHSFAADVVTQHGMVVGVEPSTRLIGQAQRWQLMQQISAAYEGPMPDVATSAETVVADALALAGELAEHLVDPAQVQRDAQGWEQLLAGLPSGSPRGEPRPVRDWRTVMRRREQLLPLVVEFAQRKQQLQVLDFPDQVAWAARIARGVPQVGVQARQRFAVVLLDEYQDTGEAQRQLLVHLFGGGHPVTAVGDPRQSIYGWRGASAGNLERFGMDFPTVQPGQAPLVCELTTSFRNAEHILTVANEVATQISPATGSAPAVEGVTHRGLRAAAGAQGVGEVRVSLFATAAQEAEQVAADIAALGGPDGVAWDEVAVLARVRAGLTPVAAALRARGVPCHIVGLGGLLVQPEVADVVSTLRVVVDPLAGDALTRLLVGPRWAIGPRDLVALAVLAKRLARLEGDCGAGADQVQPSLVEAVDELLCDPLPAEAAGFSAVGLARVQSLARLLRRLRAQVGMWLPDLVGVVIRQLHVDVEVVLAAGDSGPASARAHLAALVAQAGDFAAQLSADAAAGVGAAWGSDMGLSAWLAYLQAAVEQERGLQLADAEDDPAPSEAAGASQDCARGSVALMTIHAAKGLEWDAVFVVGMSEKVFPSTGKSVGCWVKTARSLPFELRGDRQELPRLDLSSSSTLKQVAAQVKDFIQACTDRQIEQEWRLAYVALTRPRQLLVCSGWWWKPGVLKPNGPSVVLQLVHDVVRQHPDCGTVAVWQPPPALDAVNPLAESPDQQPHPWPQPVNGHQQQTMEAAALVSAQLAHPTPLCPPCSPLVQQWQHTVEDLLARRARAEQGESGQPELSPDLLGVHTALARAKNRLAFTAVVARPMPQPPRTGSAAQVGVDFHAWVEQVWGRQQQLPGIEQALLDLDLSEDIDHHETFSDETTDPPLDISEGVDPSDCATDLPSLQRAFQASIWAQRRPAYQELPFECTIGPLVLRGRIDAVYTDDPQGLVEIIDWKTGSVPRGNDRQVQLCHAQLAIYRLAWHRLTGTPLEKIRAAFHEVATNTTISATPMSEPELIALLTDEQP